jgi:MerR family transcriptional regulator, light-induced transcriptional regulator
MYTIKQAAARTGLNVPTIRAWERRYHVVAPTRTPAGYRLYDDTSIARLRAMRRLIEGEGWRPSQAAERVLAAGDDLDSLGRSDVAMPLPTAGLDPDTSPDAQLVADFVAAARHLDVRAMELVLDDAFAGRRFERAMPDIVFPALRAVGEGWANGEIDVAAEHAASETVRRRLSQLYDAAGRSSWGPAVVVGLPPGSHHEIGAFAFAVAARRAGLDVLYLGANVPLESWLRTVRETKAPIVVLGVVTRADVNSAAVVIEALRAVERPPACYIGGPLAREVTETAGAVWLPDAIDTAVATMVQNVETRLS